MLVPLFFFLLSVIIHKTDHGWLGKSAKYAVANAVAFFALFSLYSGGSGSADLPSPPLRWWFGPLVVAFWFLFFLNLSFFMMHSLRDDEPSRAGPIIFDVPGFIWACFVAGTSWASGGIVLAPPHALFLLAEDCMHTMFRCTQLHFRPCFLVAAIGAPFCS